MKTRRVFGPLGMLGLLPLAVTGAALAGTSFTSVTHSESDRTKGQPGTHEVRTHYVIDGLGSRLEFLDDGNPMMPVGTYQGSKDGGKTRYMVDPKEKTYYPFDPDSVIRESQTYLKGAGMEQKVENVKIEKLIDEAG